MKNLLVAACATVSIAFVSPSFAQAPPTCADFIAAHQKTGSLMPIDMVMMGIMDGMDREFLWQGIASLATLDQVKARGLVEFRKLIAAHCYAHPKEPLDIAVPWVWRAAVLKGQEG